MDVLWTALLLGVVALVSGEELGMTKEDEWAYQWYEDEPFSFECQKAMPINSTQFVTWEVEEGTELKVGSVHDHYEVRTKGGIRGAELYVKMITPDVHGVYICHVYNQDGTPYNKTIFALNWREHRYRSMGDKYTHNVVVAVVSTAVFVVPLLTICILQHFHWEARHPEAAAKRKYAYADGDHEMKQPMPDDLAATVISPEGRGAYENPDFNTQL